MDNMTFVEFIKNQIQSQRFSKKSPIKISVVDTGHIEMALNLWETSLKKFHVTNHVFVCLTKKSYKSLKEYGLTTYLYKTKLNGEASYFGTENYKKKTVIKTVLVEMVLSAGYDALIGFTQYLG